jgi:hypothetical protein
MDEWLSTFEREDRTPGLIDVYELIYNRKDYFHQFLHFKETVWRNPLIPYVRYYRDGMLVDESNFVSQREFLRRFK